MTKKLHGVRTFASSSNRKMFFLLTISLALSSFFHLWNVVGFPDHAPDDGTYIRRSLHMMNGSGPQESKFYDHPYFGQIFLSAIFTVIDFPNVAISLQSSSVPNLEQSIIMLYTIPRILMGVLAVIDTLLIFKISELRYNKNVAFLSAVLFAITPVGWLLRRVYLDPIMLPFLLSSILFALKSGTRPKEESRLMTKVAVGFRIKEKQQYKGIGLLCHQNIIVLLLSGTFLGLSIFTKIPAITLIPLVGFIIFANNKKNGRALLIWIIPVIVIPMLWPIYALYLGDVEYWLDGIKRQAIERPESSISNSLLDLLRIDPILIIIGSFSFMYAVFRKDLFVILWIAPFLIFFYFIGRVSYNYWVPLLPVLCIGGSVFMMEIYDKVAKRTSRLTGQILLFTLVSSIAIFGLIVNVTLLSTDLTSSQFQAATFVQRELNKENNKFTSSSNITVISGPNFSWIFKYVFKNVNILDNFRDQVPTNTERFIMIADPLYHDFIRRDNTDRSETLEKLYDKTVGVAKFNGTASRYDYNEYPFFSIKQGRSGSEIEIRVDYQSER